MPLVTPALSALAIFTFLGNWTAFLWPLIVDDEPELYTLPVGLSSFAGEPAKWEMIMTGASVATLPTLVVFLLLQTLHRPRRHAGRTEGLSHERRSGERRSAFPRPVYKERCCAAVRGAKRHHCRSSFGASTARICVMLRRDRAS